MRNTTMADVLVRLEALETELVRLRGQSTRGVPAGHDVPDNSIPHTEPPNHEPQASRRDLLRYGAATLGAVATAGLAAQTVNAANGDPVIIGSSSNTGTASTWLKSTGGANPLTVLAQGPQGTIGTYSIADGASGIGIIGEAGDIPQGGYAVGVRGQSHSAVGGIGVEGSTDADTAGIGVLGQCVKGGIGVRGEVSNELEEIVGPRNGIAVYGANNSSYAGPGPGAGGFGVYGLSAKGHGLVGATSTAGAGAVVGATNGVSGAYAGVFYGPVVVVGNFTALGTKSAAVPYPDGSRRLVYCVESPESWFEDFGKATLEHGRAAVTLDPDFTAIVDTSEYHIFVTVYDQPNELTVHDRTACGFRISAKNPTASGTFSWRVVAKRKDIPGERLATVTIPPEPRLPEVRAVDVTARGLPQL